MLVQRVAVSICDNFSWMQTGLCKKFIEVIFILIYITQLWYVLDELMSKIRFPWQLKRLGGTIQSRGKSGEQQIMFEYEQQPTVMKLFMIK